MEQNMGVFSWFRRTSVQVSSARTDEVLAEEAPPVTRAPEAGPGRSEPDRSEAVTEGGVRDGGSGPAAAAERVEIPKQQSAEAAADNETGENARK
jgi:hypothetical protein